MFPDELKGLTPVEEKLIALNSCYGFITKYSLPEGRRQSTRYPKHVKGHITVFPNNVQDLVSNVLPHPLLKVMDEIHVSWQGSEKPAPADLSALLSVRRRVVEKALVWLKRNNPLYAKIYIDKAEMDTWETPPHGVPSQVYERLERNEPSSWEKARTGQVVPPTERGLEEGEAMDVREVLAALERGVDVGAGEACVSGGAGPESEDGGEEVVAEPGVAAAAIHEISSSGMFGLDVGPDVADVEKLRYVCDALGGRAAAGNESIGATWVGSSEARRAGEGSEPYIGVTRGEDFADSLDAQFFAKTFPTLFPRGNGGPRQAEERVEEDGTEGGTHAATARGLIASRNMNLDKWARLVLQRHGGRFATHHIFAFLVFNMGVRSRNRRVSMLSVTRRNFAEVERLVWSLSPERLEKAKAELEASGKTADEGVKQLLRSLSLYGFRQPMSRESRLSMRRKILSLIIRHGIPAIWFTLNPNDLTNPVKLRLAAHRTRGSDDAEAFLKSLDAAYKRTRLAVSDPLSSAIFFNREISMFFKHYVKTGEDSVFGRINQYFGAVETNERGSLHLHGLLWLQGNLHLSSILGDVRGEQAAYREQIIQYVDSVFAEVSVLGLVAPFRPELTSAGSGPRGVSSSPSGEVGNVQHIASAAEHRTVCGCVRRRGELLHQRHADPHAQPNVCKVRHQAKGEREPAVQVQSAVGSGRGDGIHRRGGATDSAQPQHGKQMEQGYRHRTSAQPRHFLHRYTMSDHGDCVLRDKLCHKGRGPGVEAGGGRGGTLRRAREGNFGQREGGGRRRAAAVRRQRARQQNTAVPDEGRKSSLHRPGPVAGGSRGVPPGARHRICKQ